LTKGRCVAQDRKLKVNEQIQISPVRVVSQGGDQIGVLPIEEALVLAQQAGLDLVEVAPLEEPPVCRIMDYGEFKYKLRKRKHTKHHVVHLKEIRVRPKTDVHDLEVKVKRAREFLGRKDKVLISVLFRGREMRHKELGAAVLSRMVVQLEDIAKVEKEPDMMGRRMTVTLAPRQAQK